MISGAGVVPAARHENPRGDRSIILCLRGRSMNPLFVRARILFSPRCREMLWKFRNIGSMAVDSGSSALCFLPYFRRPAEAMIPDGPRFAGVIVVRYSAPSERRLPQIVGRHVPDSAGRPLGGPTDERILQGFTVGLQRHRCSVRHFPCN